MDRSTWTMRFVARGLEIDPRLAGDDCAEAADDLIEADPEVLQGSPEHAADLYYGVSRA